MGTEATTILVATDFSDCSDRALAQGIALARQLSTRLDVVHVHDVQVPALPEMMLAMPNDLSYLGRLREQLNGLRERAAAAGVPCQVHLRVGEPVGGILDATRELSPQLVIVGSHGRGALMRALLGSVSERLCRRSPAPVLVVPAPERAAHAAAPPHTEEATQPGAPVRVAWSCANCGHIRGEAESTERCGRCGAQPALWNSAPIEEGPVDQIAPAVGESMDEHVTPERANDPAALFPTSPPGTSGYDVNPELRVRY